MKLSAEESHKALLELENAIRETNKIACIKQIRAISGLGLVDSKKMIEDAAGTHWNPAETLSTLKSRLQNWLVEPYTKEQFLQLVAHAWDTHQDLFCDPLEAVLLALNNLKAKGGLQHAAMLDEKFIDSI